MVPYTVEPNCCGQPHLLLVVWSWASNSIPPSLSFLICKIGNWTPWFLGLWRPETLKFCDSVHPRSIFNRDAKFNKYREATTDMLLYMLLKIFNRVIRDIVNHIVMILYGERWLLDLWWWWFCNVFDCQITMLYTWN